MERIVYSTDGVVFSTNGRVFVSNLLWTPVMLNTAAWYDAADVGTITEVGGAVSQWSDKSGNGNHAVQGTASLQPTTGIENIGGLNSLGFNATEDELSYNSATSLLTQGSNVHVFFVGDVPATGASFADVIQHAGGGQGFVISRRQTFDAMYLRVDSDTTFNSAIYSSAGFFDGVPHIFYANVLSDNTRAIWKDGVVDTMGGWTGNTFATSATMEGIGECSDEMGEMIIINGSLTDADRQKIEGYLAHKWGLAGNLPGGHPYETDPPLA